LSASLFPSTSCSFVRSTTSARRLICTGSKCTPAHHSLRILQATAVAQQKTLQADLCRHCRPSQTPCPVLCLHARLDLPTVFQAYSTQQAVSLGHTTHTRMGTPGFLRCDCNSRCLHTRTRTSPP
jgi:uncharacterized protein YcsI (UPF0317 family)